MKQINLLTDWKYNSWLFAGVLLICFAVSAGVRYQQFETWKKAPTVYFVDERPLMTTLDAPFWLRLAREYNDVKFGGEALQRKKRDKAEQSKKTESIPAEFLDHSPSSSGTSEINYRDVPLLSYLIAHLTPFFNNNYYLTGTLLIPVLASLFLLPLGIYFFRIGVPVSGMLGGLIGTFAGGYYMRSSIGRIDTDMLTLFFPVLTGLFILLASQARSERSVLIYSAGSGLSLFFFHWWYAKAGFILAFFAVFTFCLFIHQIRFRTILLGSLMFVLFAYPITFMHGTGNIQYFLKGYLDFGEAKESVVIQNLTNPASFPDTMTTISEVDRVQLTEVFRRILSKPMFDWAGFIAFFGLAVFRWRVLLPLAPLLALGLLSFQSSNRFIMYLAPFIGIGLGWLLQLGVEAIFILITKKIHHREDKEAKGESKKVKGERLKVKGSLWASFYSLVAGTHFETTRKGAGNDVKIVNNKVKGERNEVKEERLKGKGSLWEGREIDWFGWVRQGTLYLGMGFFFWVISSQTAISFVPAPSIHPRIFKTFLEVKKRVSDNSKLLTWWDYGHTLNDIGLGTFHDGGNQTQPKTYFIARGLISPDKKELYDITQFLATEGNGGIIKNNTSPEALLQAVRNPKLKPWDPIYLFFTADMTGKYGAISKLGSWDIVNGGSKP
ncbi:MAG TPA: hypothetical protein EYN12_05670, partial [Deltaproteobacteria bacterium]|nr:hypothetical protein [Deltaproteobacteria bacterium]